MALRVSPFLHSGPVSTGHGLSIVHLKRDLQIPTILKEHDEDDEGYSEGKVVNTRFGSFPHTTLIGLPWGSQVRASKVDTGSRGRRGQGKSKEQKTKRRREDLADEGSYKKAKTDENEDAADASTPSTAREGTEAVVASSGFIHLLPPTPENWTSSLPHRTQVVYTPDYSYILHRLRARPGTSIIEAGAGSGSFTHASARAVYNGYPQTTTSSGPIRKKRRRGKVWSFEFHEQRHEKLKIEVKDHGLEEIVEITHRDVCENGFLVNGQSPAAEAVFLDLPAPWLALPHLSRSRSFSKLSASASGSANVAIEGSAAEQAFISPLHPKATVHICTFSPCIEQVQRTVSAMRQLGWVDIEMVEIAAKRFEIRRERIGIEHGAQRVGQSTPASVDEAVTRLIEVEGTFKSFHETGERTFGRKDKSNPNSKQKIMESLVERKVYKEGKLVHRVEPEVKTHTSYLVFAILPREWTAEDEANALARWPMSQKTEADPKQVIGVSRRQLKKAERHANRESRLKAEDEVIDVKLEDIAIVADGNDTPKIDL